MIIPIEDSRVIFILARVPPRFSDIAEYRGVAVANPGGQASEYGARGLKDLLPSGSQALHKVL